MKARLFAQKGSVSIIGFLPTFNLAWDTNRILEEAAMRVLPFFARNTSTFVLNSRMPAATNVAPAVSFVNSAEQLRHKKLLQPYPEVSNYLLGRVANNQAFFWMISAILRYTQLASLSPVRYADELYVTRFKVGDIYH